MKSSSNKPGKILLSRTPASSGVLVRKASCLAAASLGVSVFSTATAGNTIYVTSLAQKVSESGGCSLQEAIYSANFDSNIAIDSTNPDHFITTECEPGNGDDTILLPSGAVLQMSSTLEDAHNPVGPSATPFVFAEQIRSAADDERRQ